MTTAQTWLAVVGLAALGGIAIALILAKGHAEVAQTLAQADADRGTDRDLLTMARGTGVDRTPDTGEVSSREAFAFALGMIATVGLILGFLAGGVGGWSW